MTDKIKVVVTDYIEPDMKWEEEQLAKLGVEFAHYQLKFRPMEEVLEKIRDAHIIVVNMVKMPRELIEKLEKCRLVIRHGAGYDNVDVDALSDRGIPLAYMPDYCSDEVAEQAIALLFACARKIVWSRKVLDESSARGQWNFDDVIPMYRMKGKTLGIIGCGRIGSLTYLKLKHFGFNFLICDPYLSQRRVDALGISLVDHETLFRNSDFITIHTPLNDETRHMVNANTLAMMKPTAYIINTSRGPMVNENDLAEALRSKKIAGAAIDVFEKEPPDPSHPLFGLDNVILTPHLSWYSEDAGWSIREKIVEDIGRNIAGQPPRFCVNSSVLEGK
ncbi:MAG TPA: C-terminal binding protein [bacterium]|nr:C-terminal binding protein [bacterium]